MAYKKNTVNAELGSSRHLDSKTLSLTRVPTLSFEDALDTGVPFVTSDHQSYVKKEINETHSKCPPAS